MYLARLVLGIGEGATFPVATRAMQNWTAPSRRAFAQGITHAFARLGNTITPPLVAWLIAPASLTLLGIPLLTLTSSASWRRPFIVLGFASLGWVIVWAWYFRDTPSDHSGITALNSTNAHRGRGASGARSRCLRCLAARIRPVTAVLATPDAWRTSTGCPRISTNTTCNWVGPRSHRGRLCRGRRRLSWHHQRSDPERTGTRQVWRNMVVPLSSLVRFMVPVFLTHNLILIILSLGAAFFCAELVIGPMWAISWTSHRSIPARRAG